MSSRSIQPSRVSPACTQDHIPLSWPGLSLARSRPDNCNPLMGVGGWQWRGEGKGKRTGAERSRWPWSRRLETMGDNRASGVNLNSRLAVAQLQASLLRSLHSGRLSSLSLFASWARPSSDCKLPHASGVKCSSCSGAASLERNVCAADDREARINPNDRECA